MAATGNSQAFCVFDSHGHHQSVTVVQRYLRTRFGEDPSSGPSIRKWYSDLPERGSMCKRKSHGRPSVSEETEYRVRKSHPRVYYRLYVYGRVTNGTHIDEL
ncbi:hypothetical protein C0J52_05862 [Blattella germanica]|nr:hypothetical protein C0J52_05862 [Blattella germanica]